MLTIVISSFAKEEQISEMSPFKDKRIPVLNNIVKVESYSDKDPKTGERIITLRPFIVRPHVSSYEILNKYLKNNFDNFRTARGWEDKFDFDQSIDWIFSALFIPGIGLQKGEIKEMYALEQKLGKQLKMLELFNEPKSEENIQLRYELMKMKRNAVNLGF